MWGKKKKKKFLNLDFICFQCHTGKIFVIFAEVYSVLKRKVFPRTMENYQQIFFTPGEILRLHGKLNTIDLLKFLIYVSNTLFSDKNEVTQIHMCGDLYKCLFVIGSDLQSEIPTP